MSTINYLTIRNTVLPAVNTVSMTYSTLTGSSITVLSTITTSTLLYSTMRGSTATATQLTLSSLTVSSINGAVPGTGSGVSAFSTLGVSSLDTTSTITTSSINVTTGTVGIGTTTTLGKMDVWGSSSKISIYAITPAEAYALSSSAKYTYFPAGTQMSLHANTNAVNAGCLIDFNAPNASGGSSNVFAGAIAGTGNGPAHFVIGRRTGTTSWAESIRIDTSGNVGIGMTNPSYQLQLTKSIQAMNLTHVNWNMNSLGYPGTPTGGALYWKIATLGPNASNSAWGQLSMKGSLGGWALNANEQMSVDIALMTRGGVSIQGIIKTNNYTNAVAVMDLQYVINASNQYDVYIVLKGNAYYGFDLDVGSSGGQSAANVILYDPSTITAVSTAPTGTFVSITSSCQMYVIANNVGIGTATPGYTLDVVGGIRATTGLHVGNGTGGVGLNLYDLPAAAWQITTGSYNLSINNNSASWTNRVTITQTGNVGIGMTNPGYSLEVNGTIATKSDIRWSGPGLNAADKKLYSPADGDLEWMTSNAAGVHGFAVSNQGTKQVYLNSAGHSYFNGGNVGIGTASPIAMLHVSNTTAAGSGYGLVVVDSANAGGSGGSITLRNSGGGNGAFASLLFENDGSTAAATGSTPTVFNNANGMIYCQNLTTTYGGNASKMGFQLWNSSAEVEVMTMLPNGNIGVNTTSPATTFDVRGTIYSSAIYTLINGTTNTNGYVTLMTGGASNTGYIEFRYAGGARQGYMGYADSGSLYLAAENGTNLLISVSATTRLTVNTSGISVNGTIYASGNITAYSDQRYKQNIVRLDRSLEKVCQLSGYSYTRLDFMPDQTHIGLMAQELKAVFPEAVSYDAENDKYSVNYGCMVAPLIESIKELKDQISTQQAQIDQQHQMIQRLLDRLGPL